MKAYLICMNDAGTYLIRIPKQRHVASSTLTFENNLCFLQSISNRADRYRHTSKRSAQKKGQKLKRFRVTWTFCFSIYFGDDKKLEIIDDQNLEPHELKTVCLVSSFVDLSVVLHFSSSTLTWG